MRAEIQKIMGFWVQLGVSGFRLDAVPFLIETEGAGRRAPDGLQPAEGDARVPDVALRRRRHAGRSERAARREPRLLRRRGRPAADDAQLRGQPAAVLRLATADIDPLVKVLEETRKHPRNAQWVQFLRSHDELDLGRLTDEQRAEGVRGVRPGEADAALRSRHQAPPRADARQRSQEARARLQPAVLAARHADDAGRRRDRHRRRPAPARARVRAHADAVDDREARRLLTRAEGGAAGDQRRDLRLPARQRPGAAARSRLAPEPAPSG